jgi:hypothetical protein
MKCAYLDKQSMTVRITTLPPTFRMSSMKSLVMSFHTTDDTSSGYRWPIG